MKFALLLDADNAAFEDPMELPRILTTVGAAVAAGATEGGVMDTNGNKVGTWALAEEPLALVLPLTADRWWRVLDDNGALWCETSSEQEARDALEALKGNGLLQRLWSDRAERGIWKDA